MSRVQPSRDVPAVEVNQAVVLNNLETFLIYSSLNMIGTNINLTKELIIWFQ